MLQIGFMPDSTNAKLCGICLMPRFRSGVYSRKAFASSRFCRTCSCRKTGRGREKHKDRSNLGKAYNLARFGIGIDRYNEMWAGQNGKCAACRRPEAECGATRLAVDHDHACCPGKGSCGLCVRALLCSQCNTALGLLRDDPHRIANLHKYAEKWTEGAK